MSDSVLIIRDDVLSVRSQLIRMSHVVAIKTVNTVAGSELRTLEFYLTGGGVFKIEDVTKDACIRAKELWVSKVTTSVLTQ